MNLSEKDIERFNKKYEPITESGCWIWTASTNNYGYGAFGVGRKVIGAHRVSYFIKNKSLPENANVLHRCDNTFCVNPNHLFLGTQKDNMVDMANKNRSTIGEKNPMSKLTNEDVAKIRSSDCEKQALMAKMFGVSQSTISMIKGKKRWTR